LLSHDTHKSVPHHHWQKPYDSGIQPMKYKKNIIKAQLNLYYKHLYISSISQNKLGFLAKLIFAFKKMLINTENAKTRNTTHSNIPID